MSSRGILLAVGLSGNIAFFLLFEAPDVIAALFGPLTSVEERNVSSSVFPVQLAAILMMAAFGFASYFLLAASRFARVGFLLLFLTPLIAGLAWLVLLMAESA